MIDAYNPFSLAGKNIVITGASSGIGRACAVECSRMGATLLLFGRDQGRLNETIDLLLPGNHTLQAANLNDPEKIELAVSRFVGTIGKINGFIHSAGIESTRPLQMMNVGIYHDLFNINVVAGFEFARILAKKTNCDPNSGSSLVFISSVMGMAGQKGKTGYCASKGALQAGCKAMALELAPKLIRVNTLVPAIVETEMSKRMFEELPVESKKIISDLHPLGFGQPVDIARAAVFLLSDASRWITGTDLVVDGGYLAT